MWYVIHASDRENSLAARQAARPAHLERLQSLIDQGVEVYTRAEEIELVQNLDRSLTLIFSLFKKLIKLAFTAALLLLLAWPAQDPAATRHPRVWAARIVSPGGPVRFTLEVGGPQGPSPRRAAVVNAGERSYPEPASLTFVSLLPDTVEVLNADNGETGPGASFGFQFANDDLEWSPGEERLPRTVAFDVPPQDIITKDNVSIKVNAVVYFRVMNPRKAVVEVENFHYATSQLAQTTLRSVLGQEDLDRRRLPALPRQGFGQPAQFHAGALAEQPPMQLVQ